MNTHALSQWFLEQEARALLTRLERIKPFALQETMLPAAALSPAALVAIERFLVGNRYELREEVRAFIDWLDREGARVEPAELQRRFTTVRLRFNDALSHFDLFSEVITQRSEAETGVWLSGLDVCAADALTLPGGFFTAPQVICYLARGPGAAVRRARTRLPGGGDNPVAIVRVPRERMVGHGIASSLVHEVGHQSAALLDLVASYRPLLHAQAQHPSPDAVAWDLFERWISEILADLHSVAKLGIGSTLGLMGVVSLPNWVVFRIAKDDPHPVPWIRVRISCAMGDALYPHPQWRQLSALWASLYPPESQSPDKQRTLAALDRTIPEFVQLLVEHRPPSLRGHSIRDVLQDPERRPERLAADYRNWRGRRDRLREAPPTIAFAVIGQARALGLVSPEAEARMVGNLLTYWALRSTLDIAEICAAHVAPPTRREQRLLETQPV
jgi:hypothetical protein